MRLFDGFDKKDLIIGTSGFYAATFALIALSMFWTEYLLLKKNSEIQYQNNLKVNAAVVYKQPSTVVSYKTTLGFGSTIMLDNETTFLMVANQVDAIMQNSKFASIYIILNCSKLDCKVKFTASEDDKFGLTKLANEQFISAWR
jgi:hypothetical protein